MYKYKGRDPIMITSTSLPPFQQTLLLHLPDLLHSMCNNFPRHLKVLILFLPILLTPFLDLRTMPLIHRSQIHLSLVLPTPRSQNTRNKGPIPRKFEFNLIIHTIIHQLLPSFLPPFLPSTVPKVAIFFFRKKKKKRTHHNRPLQHREFLHFLPLPATTTSLAPNHPRQLLEMSLVIS